MRAAIQTHTVKVIELDDGRIVGVPAEPDLYYAVVVPVLGDDVAVALEKAYRRWVRTLNGFPHIDSLKRICDVER